MNLTIKKTKLIARMMLLLMIVSTFATTGCEFFTPSQTAENSQKEAINHEPQDLIDGLVAKMQAAGYEKMEFTAEYFAFHGTFSYLNTLKIKIVDNCFLINGIVYYDDISYNNNRYPNFEALDLKSVTFRNPERYEVLLQLQELNSCYVLNNEQEDDSLFGNPILVYEMDGDYYFMACYSDEECVLKIHKATIK